MDKKYINGYKGSRQEEWDLRMERIADENGEMDEIFAKRIADARKQDEERKEVTGTDIVSERALLLGDIRNNLQTITKQIECLINDIEIDIQDEPETKKVKEKQWKAQKAGAIIDSIIKAAQKTRPNRSARKGRVG